MPECNNETWIGSEGFFSIVCHVRKLSIHRLRRVSSSSHKASKERERGERRKWRGMGVGVVGVGCTTIGTGDLSGNSSTCHHSCMSLKSVRHGCLDSAGKLEVRQQQQLETTTATTSHITNRRVELDSPAPAHYFIR